MPETAVMLLVNVKRRKKKVSLRNDVTVTNRDEKFAEVRPLANTLHKGPTVNGPRETRNPRTSGEAPKLIDPSMIAAQVDAYVRAYVEEFVFKTIGLRPSRSPRYLRSAGSGHGAGTGSDRTTHALAPPFPQLVTPADDCPVRRGPCRKSPVALYV